MNISERRDSRRSWSGLAAFVPERETRLQPLLRHRRRRRQRQRRLRREKRPRLPRKRLQPQVRHDRASYSYRRTSWRPTREEWESFCRLVRSLFSIFTGYRPGEARSRFGSCLKFVETNNSTFTAVQCSAVQKMFNFIAEPEIFRAVRGEQQRFGIGFTRRNGRKSSRERRRRRRRRQRRSGERASEHRRRRRRQSAEANSIRRESPQAALSRIHGRVQ